MATAYSYRQPYEAAHPQTSYMNGGYPQQHMAPSGYYQGQYIPSNVAAPVYQAAPVMNSHQQMYAPPPMMAAPAVNPYNQGSSYAYNNNSYYQAQVPQHHMAQQQQQQQQAPVATAQETEAVTGGVSSVLDYDLNIMTKFSTYLAFRLFGRSDTDNEKFISSLKAVLSATRLPLSSLILANYYILQKYELDPNSFQNNSDDKIYQAVTLSLVLANKSNDDNTFTNKSWSDATGLNVQLINMLEINWLNLIDWKLHDVNMERYDELMAQYNKYVSNHNNSLQYQRQAREPISPILSSSSSRFSPRDHSPSRFNSYSDNNWYGDYNTSSSTTPYSAVEPRGFKNYIPSHHKSYSYQAPEYCSRTGSYQKMLYCPCQFCSTPTRTVDWSYNIAAAC